MPKDLRIFIHQISSLMPDQIQMITEEVEPKFGVTAIAGKLANFKSEICYSLRESQIADLKWQSKRPL